MPPGKELHWNSPASFDIHMAPTAHSNILQRWPSQRTTRIITKTGRLTVT
ncbi:hypothetical protein GCK32_019134, partial [Trichostrongylus colubriformis]